MGKDWLLFFSCTSLGHALHAASPRVHAVLTTRSSAMCGSSRQHSAGGNAAGGTD